MKEEIKKALWTTIYVLTKELTTKELVDFLVEETELEIEVIEHIAGQIEEMRYGSESA